MPAVHHNGTVHTFPTKQQAFDYLYRQLEITLDTHMMYGHDTEVVLRLARPDLLRKQNEDTWVVTYGNKI